MNARAEDAFCADIVEIGRRMYARGYVASNDGNISIRLDDTSILTTPRSVSKGFMTPDMMVVVDLDGRKVRGTREASSELLMHLEVYRSRPDVRAVVHAHPPTATGFAVAGIPLDRAVLAEVVTTLGSIPIAEYATPSTPELPAAVRKYIKAHDGLLLANHGALTVAGDVYAAYYKMETIEHFARISLVARQLGREHLLSRQEVDRLQGLRGSYGIKAPAPICTDGAETAESDSKNDPSFCQVIQTPTLQASGGARLIPTDPSTLREPQARPEPERGMTSSGSLRVTSRSDPSDMDGEIRLSYRELTALIEDAVKALLGGQHG